MQTNTLSYILDPYILRWKKSLYNSELEKASKAAAFQISTKIQGCRYGDGEMVAWSFNLDYIAEIFAESRIWYANTRRLNAQVSICY